MRLMTYVRKTSDGGFEVRIIVPEKLRSTIGKSSLTKRLGRLSKSEANRLAASVIQKFRGQIEQAKAGMLDGLPTGPVVEGVPPPPSTAAPRLRPPQTLMVIFDGYLRERQPSPATIKRWRPVIAHLIEFLG